jgi:hypothetical protein
MRQPDFIFFLASSLSSPIWSHAALRQEAVSRLGAPLRIGMTPIKLAPAILNPETVRRCRVKGCCQGCCADLGFSIAFQSSAAGLNRSNSQESSAASSRKRATKTSP